MDEIMSAVWNDVLWPGTCMDVPVSHASRIHVFWDVTRSRLVNNRRSFEGTPFEALVTSRIYSEDEGVTIRRKIGNCVPVDTASDPRGRECLGTSPWYPPELASHTSSVNCVVRRLRYVKINLISFHRGWRYLHWYSLMRELKNGVTQFCAGCCATVRRVEVPGWLSCFLSYRIVLYRIIVLYCIVSYHIVLYCIVLYGIVLYCISRIVLYCIVLYGIVSYIVLYRIVLYLSYCMVWYGIVLYLSYCMVSYRIVSYRIVSYCIVWYRIVLYRIVSIVLYGMVLYRIVSYCIVLYCLSYCMVSYYIVSYCIYRIVWYRIVLYRIVLYLSYCMVWYRIVSYRIVSYRIVS